MAKVVLVISGIIGILLLILYMSGGLIGLGLSLILKTIPPILWLVILTFIFLALLKGKK